MQKSILSSTLWALAISFVLVSCEKEDEIGPNDKNSVVLEFDNRVGTQDLVLNTQTYKNAAGEDYTVTKLNYFISNIKLKKADGTEYSIADKYFLIKEQDAKSQAITLSDVPAADYVSVSFLVGVDSLKSISDVAQRTGVLDPASYGDDNMYWSWNSGYIFLKFEGTSPVVAPNAAGARIFQMHAGGFGGRTAVTPNNLRTVRLTASDDVIQVRKSTAPTVHIFADVAKIFAGSTTVKIAERNMIHSPALAGPVANNYAQMFAIDHVHN